MLGVSLIARLAACGRGRTVWQSVRRLDRAHPLVPTYQFYRLAWM